MGKRIFCLFLILCLCSSALTAMAVSKDTQNRIDQTKKEKEEAEQKKKEAEAQQNELNSAKKSMENYLADLGKQSKSLNEQIAILTGDIEDKEAEVAAKTEEVNAAQEEIERRYEDMKKRIQYMYENGQDNMTTYLASVLNGGLGNLLNQVEFASRISEYDREMLESCRELKAELEVQKKELEDEQEALNLLKEETEKKKEQVASQQRAAGSKLSQFDEMLAQKSGEIDNIEDMIAEKAKLLNELIQKAEAEERAARLKAAQDAADAMDGIDVIVGDPGISRGEISLSDYEMLLLATMIYCEAGNQGTEGQLAVGYVIMNRVRSNLYPNSLEAVLRQSRQFEPAGSGRFDLVLKAEQDDDIPNIVTQSCWNAAAAVVNGTSNVGDSLFFRTCAPVPSLQANLEAAGVPYWIIGAHIFYYYWTSYSR